MVSRNCFFRLFNEIIEIGFRNIRVLEIYPKIQVQLQGFGNRNIEPLYQ